MWGANRSHFGFRELKNRPLPDLAEVRCLLHPGGFYREMRHSSFRTIPCRRPPRSQPLYRPSTATSSKSIAKDAEPPPAKGGGRHSAPRSKSPFRRPTNSAPAASATDERCTTRATGPAAHSIASSQPAAPAHRFVSRCSSTRRSDGHAPNAVSNGRVKFCGAPGPRRVEVGRGPWPGFQPAQLSSL